MGELIADRPLWRPSAPESTAIHHFSAAVALKHALELRNYHDLWQWSVDQPAAFWEEVWNYTGVKAHQPFYSVSSQY